MTTLRGWRVEEDLRLQSVEDESANPSNFPAPAYPYAGTNSSALIPLMINRASFLSANRKEKK